MDLARGEFVYFVDDDDWLEPDALERMHAAAIEDGADIVIGKVVGHGKSVPRGMFRETCARRVRRPAARLLTPHKLFRRRCSRPRDPLPRGAACGSRTTCSWSTPTSTRGRSRCWPTAPTTTGSRARDPRERVARRLEPEGYFGNVREVLDLVEGTRSRGRSATAAHPLVPRQDAPARDGPRVRASARRPAPASSSRRSARWRSSATTSASTSGSRSTCRFARRCCAAATQEDLRGWRVRERG